jgi:hypothetical protein
MLAGIVRGKQLRPRRCLIYGTGGIGKSTWAAAAPHPVVIATEDGVGDVDCDKTPLCRTTTDVGGWLMQLSSPDVRHEYDTVVIDSVDWLERMVWDATARDEGKKTIEDFGYGKGYVFALRRWEQLLRMLDQCRARSMNVILIAHAKVERFAPPEADPYDRWVPDLHKSASALLVEWCDEVLFARYLVNVITREDKFNQKRTRAVGTNDRVLCTCEAPTHLAKRRIEMPDQIPLDWSAYQQYWPQAAPAAPAAPGNISGLVREGHSKQKRQEVVNG